MSDHKRVAEEYNELLLEAIDTIVAARLTDLPYDKSIRCTITDVSQREAGIYKVSDGSTIFTAYSENKLYAIDTIVMVTIPNGDWSQKKYITGRYASDNESDPYIYVDPLAQVVNLSDELVSVSETSTIIATGDEQITSREIFSYKANQPWNTLIYNTFGVSAEFQTFFDAENMLTGSYGLEFIVTTDMNDTITFQLNTEDMFGDPYAYKSWMYHSQSYTINEDFGNIISITCNLVQNGKFAYFDGRETVPYYNENEIPNISVRNIKLFLGANVAAIKDNTVKLYSIDDIKYQGTDESYLYKQPILIWYNKEEGNNFVGFRDGVFNQKYAMSEKYTEATAEEANKLIDKEEDKVQAGDEIYPIPSDDTTIYYWIEWYCDNEFGKPELISLDDIIETNTIIQQNFLQVEIKCKPELTKTNVYAIVWQNKHKYISNTITYENQTDISQITSNKDITISIEHGRNSTGIYALYGEDNRLILPSNQNKRRYLNIAAKWTRGYLTNEYWKNSIIEWRVPKGNSMLKFPKEIERSDAPVSIQVTETNEYTACSYDFVYEKKIDDKAELVQTTDVFYYHLSESFNPSAKLADNTITCIISDKQNEFTPLIAQISFNFSSIGNSGTEYTITIVPKEGDYIFTTGDSIVGSQDLFNFMLTDPDNNTVEDAQWNVKLPQNIALNTYNVLEATTMVKWADRSVRLSSEYPIQFSLNGRYSSNAPLKIAYNAEGSLSNISLDGMQLELYEDGELFTSPELVKWHIVNINLIKPENEESQEYKKWAQGYSLVPHLNEEKTHLSIPLTFGTRIKSYIFATINDIVVWQAPIILKQYLYNSEVLNNWTGKTIVDEENNRILSSAFVAGKMNMDNNFDGVVLGCVGDIAKDTTGTGLYGYKNGQQSYAFKDDGSAFIGLPGTGRIYFDGDPEKGGIIASQGWINPETGAIETEGGTGLKINLKDGSLISQNFSINSDGSAIFEGVIKAQEGNIGGWEIKSGTLPLVESSTKTNIIHNYSYLGTVGAPENTLYISQTGYLSYTPELGNTHYIDYGTSKDYGRLCCIFAKGKFAVDINGQLFAKDAVISGNITANNGTIGNFKVYGKTQYGNLSAEYGLFGALQAINGVYYGVGFDVRPGSLISNTSEVFAIGQFANSSLDSEWGNDLNFYIRADGTLFSRHAIFGEPTEGLEEKFEKQSTRSYMNALTGEYTFSITFNSKYINSTAIAYTNLNIDVVSTALADKASVKIEQGKVTVSGTTIYESAVWVSIVLIFEEPSGQALKINGSDIYMTGLPSNMTFQQFATAVNNKLDLW